MLSIDRRIIEKISLDNELSDSAARKNKSTMSMNKANRLHSNPIEMKLTPQNETYLNNALRA